MLSELDVAALTQDHGEPIDRAVPHEAAKLTPGPRFSESTNFGFPSWIWKAFFGSYALFFAALAFATARDGRSTFVIVVSVLFAVMFFGTAAVLQGLGKGKAPVSIPAQRMLNTCTGPMSTASVAAQVLTITVLITVFAVAIVILRAIIGL